MTGVDWTSDTPAHEQIAALLQRRIAAGEFDGTMKLPHREDLAAEYDVSHVTITRATALLREEGLVVYRPGRGLMLNDTNI